MPAAHPDEQHAGGDRGKPAQGHAHAVVEHLTQCAHGKRAHAAGGHDECALERVHPRAHVLGDVALHGRLAQDVAVRAEEAAGGAVGEHERVGEPQQHGIHQVVEDVDEQADPEALLARHLDRVLEGAADGPSDAFRGGEERVQRSRESWRGAEERDEDGGVAGADAVGHRHIAHEAAHALLAAEPGRRLADIGCPECETRLLALLTLVFRHMHEALDQGGLDGESTLDHEQARHADGVEQHGGEGRHDHDERGEEHGRDRIALLLGAGRDDLGVDARPRELVDRLEAGQHERDRKVGDVGERREGEPAPQRSVGDAAHHISRHEEGLARKAVHEGRDDQRHEHVGYELDRDDEGGCERGARLVEDEERDRELARDTACSAEDGRKRYEREVAGPEIDVVGRGLLDPGGIGWHGASS